MGTKYQKGQTVCIRTDLKDGLRYPMENSDAKILFVSGMEKFKGRQMVISRAGNYYYLTGGEGYAWSDGMFELPDCVHFTSLL